MAPFQSFSIIMHLVLLCAAKNILTLLPANPVVSLGGSINLNCSINCQGGSTSWKGLDTNLGRLHYGSGYSVLSIQNATIPMEGMRICVGSCPGAHQNLYGTVRLEVYALPEYLHLTSHIEEHSNTLRCSIYGVYPPSTVLLSWFRGSNKLEVPREEMFVEEGDELMNLTSSIEETWLPGTTYRCEAQLSVGDHVFRRERTIQVPNKAENTTTDRNPRIIGTTSTTTSPNTEYTSASESRTTQVIQGRSTKKSPDQKAMDSLTQLWKTYMFNTTKATSSGPTSAVTYGSIGHSSIPATEEPPNQATSIESSGIVDVSSTSTSITENHHSATTKSEHWIHKHSTSQYHVQGVTSSSAQSNPDTEPHHSVTGAAPQPHLFGTIKPVHAGKPTRGLELIWISLPSLGIMGSILLILQLWRRISRRGSFQIKQL